MIYDFSLKIPALEDLSNKKPQWFDFFVFTFAVINSIYFSTDYSF